MNSAKVYFMVLSMLMVNSAYGACRSGQITTVVKPFKVSKKNSDTGKMLTVLLSEGTEVHVVKIIDSQMEILALNDRDGNYVNGLGTVNSNKSVLGCQQN